MGGKRYLFSCEATITSSCSCSILFPSGARWTTIECQKCLCCICVSDFDGGSLARLSRFNCAKKKSKMLYRSQTILFFFDFIRRRKTNGKPKRIVERTIVRRWKDNSTGGYRWLEWTTIRFSPPASVAALHSLGNCESASKKKRQNEIENTSVFQLNWWLTVVLPLPLPQASNKRLQKGLVNFDSRTHYVAPMACTLEHLQLNFIADRIVLYLYK